MGDNQITLNTIVGIIVGLALAIIGILWMTGLANAQTLPSSVSLTTLQQDVTNGALVVNSGLALSPGNLQDSNTQLQNANYRLQ